MGIRLGLFAVDLVKQRKTGYATCLRGTEIVPVRIEEMTGKLKTIDEGLFELTGVFSTA
jgi:6-phosphofructokinase